MEPTATCNNCGTPSYEDPPLVCFNCQTMKNKKTFAQLFAESDCRMVARKRAAGKHKCVWQKSGDIRQVTRGDKIIKRPKAIAQFYECKLCGEVKIKKL